MKTLTIFFSLFFFVSATFAGNFYQDFAVTWGGGRAKSFDNGNSLTLTLDRDSGSGFRSKRQFLFGKIDMKIKLVPGNSAGTVTTYYLSSLGQFHDEIDFEFLGNLSGQPYVMHTNVYAQGKGSKEQQFYLWFDPTKDFHTYSIQWNPQSIIFSVDGTPVRQFKNLESRGIPFPKSQPMWIYASLWNADDWATRGGLVKTDWSKAPFYATFTGFNALSCPNYASCSTNSWFSQSLDYAATFTHVQNLEGNWPMYPQDIHPFHLLSNPRFAASYKKPLETQTQKLVQLFLSLVIETICLRLLPLANRISTITQSPKLTP